GDAPTAAGEPAGDPSAQDTEDRDDGVDAHQVNPAILYVEVACLFEVIRQPDEKEPPDRIGQKFSRDERPGLAMPQHLAPSHFARACNCVGCVALDVCEFPGGDPARFLGMVKE